METRARRQSLRAATAAVPSELWLLILSLLEPKDAIAASCVCSEFRHVAPASAKRAIQRLFPHHSARVAAKIGATGVQKLLALIAQHESEAKGHPDVQKATQVQKLVLPEHRQIAVEWLIEVAWDWQLESTVVYRGAQYLDHYLASYPVPALSKFQMLAISSLRTALKHSSKLAERERARLPYKHWAEVTDGACTEAEVRSTCAKLERLLGTAQRGHPNAKQRLRYLWYRLYDAGVVKQEHVYAYMLASFLLHLSLLDCGLSAVTPTLLAVAALSLSLDVFGFAPWPAALQEHCLYSQGELQEVQQKLRTAQQELPAKQLRAFGPRRQRQRRQQQELCQ
ncbi:hypothetical protein OEZ85_007588 [Tetradesmus obliquus]|uniref:Cyclin-F n=1 Tax=Tetradesmus obliquus TaxID=3088 RepID=A0ABY8TI43_TETOB|nr:hypothetical protein OEZ85_007588 [Tetradesmus obliquus]